MKAKQEKVKTVRMRMKPGDCIGYKWQAFVRNRWIEPYEPVWYARNVKRSGNAQAKRMKLTPRWE